MASPGDRGAAKAKHLRVLVPFTCDTLRIPDELAAEIGAEGALVVGRAGSEVKLWPVEEGKDGEGAFLGREWPEFAYACGAGAGWLLVLRHRGRGVLSAKAFDATCCLRELGTPAAPAAQATSSSKDSTHKLQFIRVLQKDFMEKMLIPAKFVQQHITKEFLDMGTATVLGPVPSASIQKQQEISNSSSKCKRKSNWPSTDREKRPKGSMTSSKMKSSVTNCAYELGPPAWLTKKINTSMMRKHHLTVPCPFCNAIGLQKHCMITLQDSMGSNISWQVHGKFYKNGGCQLGSGWKKFCQDIGLKNGDILTVKVIKTQLWDVIITRS